MRTCEHCGASEKSQECYDYCDECCKNLCPECMAAGCCRSVPAISGAGENATEETK